MVVARVVTQACAEAATVSDQLTLGREVQLPV